MSERCDKEWLVRLVQFSVTNFRSMLKAEKLPLGEFTVLVGPNNEGKSNILQAMVLGMEALSLTQTARILRAGSRTRTRTRRAGRSQGYDWMRDVPQSLQAVKPDGRTTMRFDFQLTPEENEEFYAEVGSKLNTALPISISFGRTGSPQFTVRKPRHGAALSAKRDDIARFIGERVDVQYISAIRTGEDASGIVSRMLARELNAAADDPDYAAALAKVRELRQPVLDALSVSVTQKIRDLLPDVERVEVRTRSEQDDALVVLGDVEVIVDDGVPTDLIYKGDGVQSLAALAMTQHYSSSTARALEFILAVEEPEAHLHPRAIHALRDALRQTASEQQVIITTHSPLFANRLDLASNIIVRKNKAQPAQSVAELREVLGVRTADNLASAELILLVEGMADEISIRALLAQRSGVLAKALQDGVLAITGLRGGGNLPYLLRVAQESLAVVHIFLDDDDQGRQSAQVARADPIITPADVTMASCLGARQAEFEDLVDPERYRDRLLREFNVDTRHPWMKQMTRGKWSRRLALVFQASGAQWDDSIETQVKTLVAECVAADPASAILLDRESVLAGLVNGLETKLKSRLGT